MDLSFIAYQSVLDHTELRYNVAIAAAKKLQRWVVLLQFLAAERKNPVIMVTRMLRTTPHITHIESMMTYNTEELVASEISYSVKEETVIQFDRWTQFVRYIVTMALAANTFNIVIASTDDADAGSLLPSRWLVVGNG
jgi:hypothetical protein